MSSSKRTIVITGASGTNGRDLAKALDQYKDKVTVRLLVRDPAKSSALSAYGTLIKADLADPSTLDAAFAGADALFLLVPYQDNAKQLASNALEAAKKHKLTQVVALSAEGANPKGPIWVSRDHGEKEELVKASGIPYTILRPTFFMSNLLHFNRATLESQGAYYGASGEGKYPAIDPADIAAVAAKVLTSPSTFDGRTLELNGPDFLSESEIAALASQIWGKQIKYVDVGFDNFKKTLLSYGVPENQADSTAGLNNFILKGWIAPPNNTVQEVLGRPPNNWKNYLTANRL